MRYGDVDMTPTRSLSRSRARVPTSERTTERTPVPELSSAGDDNDDNDSSNVPSLGCCHNTLELTTNALHICHSIVGVTFLSYAIALSCHKPDPQHGAAILLELYAILLLAASSTGFLGSRPHKPRCKRIPLRISIQLAPILAGLHCLTMLILLVEHASLWNYIMEKRRQFFLSDQALHFLQTHVHVGMIASILAVAAVSELMRYCLLQRLKDRLVAHDEQVRRDFLDDRARDASSSSSTRRRRNWYWGNNSAAGGEDGDRDENDDDNAMTTPLLSDAQSGNWAMENVSVQSQSGAASASASAMNQSAASWWEEPDTNTNADTSDADKGAGRSWFSKAFDRTPAKEEDVGGRGRGHENVDTSTSSVDFAPIDADMEMGSRPSLNWAEDGTTEADESGGFALGSGGGGNQEGPDLSWVVEKDD